MVASAAMKSKAVSAVATIIVDPPRAGLHPKVIDRILEIKPPHVVYLSCNPATQARDLKLLAESYTITQFEIYNFFPKTPHIETLAILALTNKQTIGKAWIILPIIPWIIIILGVIGYRNKFINPNQIVRLEGGL